MSNIKISDLLGHGQANAISIFELEKQTNLSERQIMKLIQQERESGTLILSGGRAGQSGFFLPADNPLEAYKEIRRTYSRMRSQSLRTLFSCKKLKEALDILPGQYDSDDLEPFEDWIDK